MAQVQYIGTCNKQDSIRGVGLRWHPGQTRNVSPELAERLLCYPDTWVKDESAPVDGEPIGLIADEKPIEEPLPVVDFHAMTKDQIVEYADKNYGERLDKRQSAETLRIKLVGIVGQHELDNEGKK
jgi:hypothetical protein